MKHIFTRTFLITILLLAVLTACESNDSDSDETVEPTTSSTASDSSTEEIATTEAEPTAETTVSIEETLEPEATATEELAEATDDTTPEAVETVEISQIQLPNASDDGAFSFVVVDLFDDYSATNIPAAPDNNKIVMIRAALTNQSSEAISTAPGSLQAFDAEGNRYSAELPAQGTQPSLINIQIPAGEIFTGYAHFFVPDNSEVVGVEWCPTSECSQPLSMRLR